MEGQHSQPIAACSLCRTALFNRREVTADSKGDFYCEACMLDVDCTGCGRSLWITKPRAAELGSNIVCKACQHTADGTTSRPPQSREDPHGGGASKIRRIGAALSRSGRWVGNGTLKIVARVLGFILALALLRVVVGGGLLLVAGQYTVGEKLMMAGALLFVALLLYEGGNRLLSYEPS